MKKLVLALVALAAIVAVATPALAEFKVSGYYRTQGIATNSDDSLVSFDGPNAAALDSKTQSMVDARLRFKAEYILNENLSLVHFSEVDATWGDSGKDGGPGGDRTSIETKNVYMNYKQGMVNATVGLQGLGDRYQGLLIADDWSAAKVSLALTDGFKLTGLWAKPDEGTSKLNYDDTDLYMVSADGNAGSLKYGLDVAWLDQNQGTLTSAGPGDSPIFFMTNPLDLYFVGASADAKISDDFGISAFGLYVTGSEDIPGGADVTGYTASIAADIKADKNKFGARVLYMSADDFSDADSEAFTPNLGGNYDLAKENLMIFYTDAFYNNGPGGRLATASATNNGTGLIGLSAKADLALGDYYAKLGAGYFMAADTPTGVDDSLGYEVAARIGRVFAEKLDTSVNLAYAGLGDYWKDAGAGNDDDIWKATVMMNINF